MIKRGLVGLVAVIVALVGVVPSVSASPPSPPPSASRAASSDPSPAQKPSDPPTQADIAAAAAVPVSSQTFQVGPLDLAPAGQPGDEINRTLVDMPRPEGDLAIRGITWRLVDMDGNPVERHMVHLHHIVLLDTSRRDQLCSFPSASRFAGTGMELTPLQFPEPYAYHSKAGAPWQGVYNVANLGDMPMQVSIEYTVEWSEPGAFLDVEPYFFDVTGCWGTSTFDVPGGGGAGSVYETSNEYTMTRQGRFVGVGAHMHDGAIDVALSGPGGEVCRAAAMYEGDPPMMMGIEPCGPIDDQFEVGDHYTLTARYHNEEPIAGAMGIMFGYIHHTDPPPPLPTVDIEFSSLDSSGLHVLLTCANADEVYLDAQVTQVKQRIPVDAWGWANPPCNPEPTVITLPLEGLGVLVPGQAHVQLSVSASSGRDYAYDSVSGDFRVTGRLVLAPTLQPDGGPNPITIDARVSRGDQGLVLTGTVQCDVATEVWLTAQGWQLAGLHAVQFYGQSSFLPCDGVTPFALPVQVYEGRLVGGPAQVQVSAYSGISDEPSVATRTVTLVGGPPVESQRPPAPPSPLSIVSVHRTPAGLAVTLHLDDCPVGAQGYADVYVKEVSPPGTRVEPPGSWAYLEFTCSGGAATFVLTTDLQSRRRQVTVDAYLSLNQGENYTFYSTWATVPVVR